MSSSDGPRFSCPTCGKSFRWKPEFAGRSAKCACGAKLVVPTEAPAASDAADIPLAPEAKQPAIAERITASSAPIADAKCPSCSAPLDTGAILCVNCGYNLNTGKKLAAVVVETEGEDEEAEESPADAEERA
jgi:uncharacterized Zn finger protein (UPF0148 family)